MEYAQTVYVVDDDRAIRDSLQQLGESVGLTVKTFDSGESFVRACKADMAGCVVLDVRMPGMSGLSVQAELNRLGATLPVIVMTGYADVPMVIEAMHAGAVEFLEKPCSSQTLLDHIQRALRLDAKRRKMQAERATICNRIALLTRRERQVLDGIIEGKLNKQIAADLGISERTVEDHRARVMAKMETGSVATLVRECVNLLCPEGDSPPRV